MTYQAIYKCRLCGEKFPIKEKVEMNDVPSLGEKKIHICDDGSIGVADFQGFKAVEE